MALTAINNYFKAIANDVAVLKRNAPAAQETRPARIASLALRVFGGLMVTGAVCAVITLAVTPMFSAWRLYHTLNIIAGAVFGHDCLQMAHNIQRRCAFRENDGFFEQIFNNMTLAAATAEDDRYEATYRIPFVFRDCVLFSIFAKQIAEPVPA